MIKQNKLIFSILIITICTSIIIYKIYSIVFATNIQIPNKPHSTRIYIQPETSLNNIITELTEQNIIFSPNKIKYTAKLLRINQNSIKAGCYKINDGDSSWDLLQRIKRGEQTPVKLTINNLRTPEQFASKISKQLMIDSASVMHFVTDSNKMANIGFKPNQLFVLVISNTYEVWWTIKVEELMKRMKSEHEKFWQQNERQALAASIGLTPSEVITLASIVDEETNKAKEKKRIAGLYLNRLRCGMLLQSDPTVKFAIGDFNLTQILYSHLLVDSRYNTYKYAGLPPGPIRMPSISTIDAVLNAEKHNYLYMCASPKMDGTHRFAKHLSEHNKNAQQYHHALRQWKAKQK